MHCFKYAVFITDNNKRLEMVEEINKFVRFIMDNRDFF